MSPRSAPPAGHDRANPSPVRKARDDFHWDGVDVTRYKDAGSAPFRDVTRQVLFDAPGMAGEWRYFEVAPGGHSTLERHAHPHAVMVLRGRGRCLVGDAIHALAERDLVHVPPMTWHQFRSDDDAPLGFLCLVDKDRDRPQLPTRDELAALAADPAVAAFVRP